MFSKYFRNIFIIINIKIMFHLKSSSAGFFIIGLALMITSCSPSTTYRTTGKYSSAEKRNRTSSKTKENKSYSHSTKKSKSTDSNSNIETIRFDIVESAKKYQGINYKPGGKLPETGFDCSGFTGFVFTKNGIPISGPSDKLAKMGRQKSKSDLKAGDLVFFGHKEKISHVAIVSNNSSDQLEVVHATTSSGVKIDEISHSEYWQSRFLFGVDIISR